VLDRWAAILEIVVTEVVDVLNEASDLSGGIILPDPGPSALIAR
jgi:hypothetical protein